MGSLTNYGEDKWLEHLFSSPLTPPANLFLALCTGDPGEGATGAAMNEVANSNNYGRATLAFGAAASRRITQNADSVFPQASGAWGTITHWAVVDSQTYGAGNVWAYGAFASSFAPVAGNTPKVASGQIYVEVSASSGKGFVTQLCNWMLDKIFRNQTYAQPNTYIALLNSVGADGDTTLSAKEISGTAYARVLVNKAGGSVPKWSAVASGATDNADEVAFPTVGAGGWTQLVGMVIVDAATLGTGNVLMFDNDNVVDQTPAQGDTVKFAAGALDVSLS